MQCPQEHLKTIVYAKFGGQTKCIMGNSKIENAPIGKKISTLGTLSRVKYSQHSHWESRNPIVLSPLDSSSERVKLIIIIKTDFFICGCFSATQAC